MKRKRALSLFVLAAAVAVGACGGPSGQAPSQTSAAAAPGADVPAEQTAALPSSSQAAAELPKACEDYVARARACIAKARGGQAAADFSQLLEQSHTQWRQMTTDPDALAAACRQADAQFPQIATDMQCE